MHICFRDVFNDSAFFYLCGWLVFFISLLDKLLFVYKCIFLKVFQHGVLLGGGWKGSYLWMLYNMRNDREGNCIVIYYVIVHARVCVVVMHELMIFVIA